MVRWRRCEDGCENEPLVLSMVMVLAILVLYRSAHQVHPSDPQPHPRHPSPTGEAYETSAPGRIHLLREVLSVFGSGIGGWQGG